MRFVALLLGFVACSHVADPLPADGPGPYDVGVRALSIRDDRVGALTLELWYPAVSDPALIRGGYAGLDLPGEAYRDAVPDRVGAPYPLVAFSHGNGGVRFQSAALCERIASHGFVVVAMDHPDNTLFDLDPDKMAEVAVRRPGDVIAAVDAIDALVSGGGSLSGLAVTDRYAVAGHSFGAFTALAVGGGELDVDGVEAHCAETPTAGCGFLRTLDGVDVSAARPDPRAQAVIGLATGAYYAFGRDGSGLDGVRAPLLLAGTRDGDLPYDTELRPTWQALGHGPLFSLENAGHWAFSDLCTVLTTLQDCQGASGGFMEPSRTLAITQTAAVAHLKVELQGQVDAEVWLDQAAWSAAEVTVER